jgi:signal transduction histidine kinase
VAHEVNNPLTSVLGYTDLLLAELPAGSPQRADLEVIRSEADRAGAIVRSLLDFARPRSPRLASVDLEEMVRAWVEVVRRQAGRKGVRVVESFAALPLLALDAAAIQETILALLANALAAMPNGGTLRVTIVSDPDGALVRVEDDGVGIDEDTLARAFRPFFSRRGGRGLGLSVARALVEAHGGTVVLASAAGRGTVAEVRLPFAVGSVDAPAA